MALAMSGASICKRPDARGLAAPLFRQGRDPDAHRIEDLIWRGRLAGGNEFVAAA